MKTILIEILLLLLCLGVTALAGCRSCSPSPTPIPSGKSDAGLVDAAGPCNANLDANACGCCFTAAGAIVCPAGVEAPDAAVLTLPVCGQL
jgi:hypothetical protein